MDLDTYYMQRCLQLAACGMGRVAPNPMVGAVLVHQGHIVAEGYHRHYGGAHAEPNAIAQVCDKALLSRCTLYVSLEPCNHQGKTGPCAPLVVQSGIRRVVVATQDPFAKVNGSGIAYMRQAGVEVVVGVLEQQAQALNRRFFTFHRQGRPYVILKWAQTSDGYIDRLRLPHEPPLAISNAQAHRLSHKWRTEEAAIMVGTRTALLDNPSLTARLWSGPNPTRVVVDAQGTLPHSLALFNNQAATLVLHTRQVPQMLQQLHAQGLQSVIVEGGARLLQSFIDAGLWDEARVFTAPTVLGQGVPSPTLTGALAHSQVWLGDNLLRYWHRCP